MGRGNAPPPFFHGEALAAPFPSRNGAGPRGSVLPPYSNADTLRRSSGTTSASNQGFFRSHAVFRQLG